MARANALLFFFDLDPTPDRDFPGRGRRQDSAPATPRFSRSAFRPRRLFVPLSSGITDRAPEELAIARPSLPNSTPFFILSGYINRRRNHFHEAERDFSTAFALDPRNPNAYNLLAELTCSNAGFLNRSTSMTTCLPPASRLQSSGTDAPHPPCRELLTLGQSAIFWQNFRTWSMLATRRRDACGWRCSTATMSKRNGSWPPHPVKIFKTSTLAFIFPRVGIRRWSHARKAI